MNYISLLLLSAALTVGSLSSGQELKQAGAEDFIPSTLNQPGKQYPQVNSEGRVRASISAPQAMKVQLDIGGVKYDLKKDDKGVWTGDSDPQDEGFHYYQLVIDGAQVPQPLGQRDRDPGLRPGFLFDEKSTARPGKGAFIFL